MGILPPQFEDGQNVESRLASAAKKTYDFRRPHHAAGVSDKLANGRTLKVKAKAADGSVKQFTAKVRIDTPQEIEYYEHGFGILQYVLRQLAAK